jgi:polyketide synthase 12
MRCQLASGLSDLDGYFGGLRHAAHVRRLSRVLGLEGPTMTVDTACSSSLGDASGVQRVRVKAVRSGGGRGCDLDAGAGPPRRFSRLRGMSTDGRCKSFSSTADGTGWSEGAAVVVLKRCRMPNGMAIRPGVLRGTA